MAAGLYQQLLNARVGAVLPATSAGDLVDLLEQAANSILKLHPALPIVYDDDPAHVVRHYIEWRRSLEDLDHDDAVAAAHPDDRFDGCWVRIELSTFERLVAAAESHHASRARWVDETHPEQAISDWLDDLERPSCVTAPRKRFFGGSVVEAVHDQHEPWQPAEWQQQILDELDAGIVDLEEACDRLTGNLPPEVGAALDASLLGVRTFAAGMRRAKDLVHREMERISRHGAA